jgi:uncharacterized protein with GYD domain
MPHFLIEAAYKDTAAKAMIANPQGRSDVIGKACQSLGGRLISLYFAFGDYDVIVIVELPDNQAAMALAMAVGASGALSKYRTTVLLSPDEAVGAMQKAKEVGYSAPR